MKMNALFLKGILILTAFFWGINLNAQYCLVSTTSSGDYLSAVSSVGATSNINYTASSQPVGSYADQTAQSLVTYGTQTFDVITTYVGGSNGVNIWVDWGNDFTFDATDLIAYQASSAATKTFTITVPTGIPTGSYRARVRGQYGATANPAACGSVNFGSTVDFTITISTPPSCLTPTNLLVSSIVGTTMNLGWTENNAAIEWELEYGSPGYTAGTGTTINVTSNPYAFTFTLGTEYDFYVRSICGPGDVSFWSSPLKYSYCGVATTNTGDRLSVVNSSGAVSNVSYTASVLPPGSYANETAQLFESYETQTFDINTTYVGGGNGVNIWVDWNKNMVFDAGELVASQVSSAASKTLSVTVPTGTAQGDYRMRVRGQYGSAANPPACGSVAYGTTVDFKLTIGTPPSCLSPTAFVASNIFGTSVDLDWIESGTATAWNIEWGLSGYTPGLGTNVPLTANSHTLSGLSTSTGYDIYVQANCGGSLSNWTGPISITTACGTFTAPFYEGFNAAIQPNCWLNVSSGTGTGINNTWNFNKQGEYGALANGRAIGTFVSSDGSTPNPDSMMLTTPWIDLSALTVPELTFEWFSNNTDTPGDNVPLHIDINNGTAWTNIATYQGDDPLWQDESIILSAYAGGTIQIRFRTDQSVPGVAYHNDILLDEVSVIEAPTCPQPASLMASSITANSVNLNWTETGSATLWNLEYGPVGYTQGSAAGTNVPANSNPFTLTGLNPATDYDVYLQSECGVADLSTWEGPFSFTTLCLTQMAGSYTVGTGGDFIDFTAAVLELNTCGVSGAVIITALTGSGPYNEQLIIEEIVGASAVNTVTLEGNGETLTSVTTTGDKSLILLDGTDYTTINNFNLVTQSITDNYVIQLINDADFNTISNNNIDLTSTLTSTSTSNAGVVVSGSLTSATGTTGTSGFDNSITGNTIIGGYYGITVVGQSSNLTENNIISDNILEDFYYYGIYLPYGKDNVVANNDLSRPNRTSVSSFYALYFSSGGEGHTISGNNIHTPFGGITSASTSAGYGVYFTGIDSPLGNESKLYNNIINLSGNNGTMYGIYNSSSDGVHYFHNTIVMDDASSTSGITRGFYQTSTATDIEFKNNIINITRAGSGAKQCMYFSTAASTIVSDYNVLYMNSAAGANDIGYVGGAQATLAAWQLASSDDLNSVGDDPILTNIPAASYLPSNPAVNNIGVPLASVTTDFNGNLRSVTAPDPGAHEFTPPACPQPTSLTAINITSTSLDLGWIENGTATGWNIQWGAAGFNLGSGANLTAGSNPYLLSGLSPSTDYDIYIQADCGGGDLSTWLGPVTLTTGCVVYTAPFYEGFNTAVQPQCWENISSGTGTGINNNWNFNKQGEYGALTNGKTIGTFVSSDGSVPNPDSMMLFTPMIDLSALTTPALTFEWFSNNTNNPGDNVPFIIDIYNGTTWTNIDTLKGDNALWLEEYYDLSAYAGNTVQIRFMTNQSVPVTAYYNDILLDEVSIIEAPICTDPTALTATNITGTSADLSWTENGTASSWKIEYGATGFTAGTGTIVVGVSTNPFSLVGINPCSDYDYYVQADCGASQSAWVGPFAFSTLSTPVTGTDTQVACETFTWIDGMVYTASNNTAMFTIAGAAAFGCDSLITLDLTINTSVTGTDTQVACETFTWIDGTVYTADNNTATFTIVGGAANGCDSIVTLNLTFDMANSAGNDDMIVVCMNQPVDLGALLSSGADAGGVWLDPIYATLPSSQITASAQPGAYDYSYVVQSGACPADTAVITISVDPGCDYLSIEDQKLVDISVYPNPATSVLTILNPSNTSSLKVEMLDMNGRIVLVENQALNNATKATLAIEHLERGVYTLRVYNTEGQKTFKIVKR
jgi:parallel beta-helix repeat protein